EADGREAFPAGQRRQQLLTEFLVTAVAQAPAGGVALTEQEASREASGRQLSVALQQGGPFPFESAKAAGDAPAGGAGCGEEVPGRCRPVSLGVGGIGVGSESVEGIARDEFIRRHGGFSGGGPTGASIPVCPQSGRQECLPHWLVVAVGQTFLSARSWASNLRSRIPEPFRNC